MHDLPSVTRLQQASSKAKSGEELETLGKQAAALYSCGDCNLSEAVVEVTKKAGLSPQQVQRVVEFTNTHAYLERFNKEADHKFISFDGGPADPSVVLKDLNDGGGGTVFDKGDLDYTIPPPDVVKKAAVNESRIGVVDTRLQEAFGVEDAAIPYEEPLRDAWDTHQKLAAAYDQLTGELSALEGAYLDITGRLFGQVKQASLEGTSLGQIVSVWGVVTEDPGMVKAAFSTLAPLLLENGVFSHQARMIESLEKTATVGMVNTEHPLINDFAEYCDVLQKMAHRREAREEVAEALMHVDTFIRKTAGIVGSLGKGVGTAWRTAAGATRKAAPHVEKGTAEFLESAGVGKGVAGGLGKGVGTVVKYSPHAAMGLGAEEAYQRSRYSPAVQAVASRIPGTRANIIRKQVLAAPAYG